MLRLGLHIIGFGLLLASDAFCSYEWNMSAPAWMFASVVGGLSMLVFRAADDE